MLTLTDAQIQELISEAKAIPAGLSPLAKTIERNQHSRKDFEIVCPSGNCFVIATRQSMLDALNFSAILGFRNPGFNSVFRLRRYNGKHYHTNPIEGERFHDFHVHTATERYQRIGSREDHFAQIDKRYFNLESAIQCLLDDCGFRSTIQDAPLFTGIME